MHGKGMRSGYGIEVLVLEILSLSNFLLMVGQEWKISREASCDQEISGGKLLLDDKEISWTGICYPWKIKSVWRFLSSRLLPEVSYWKT
jgi:hypothetical protein